MSRDQKAARKRISGSGEAFLAEEGGHRDPKFASIVGDYGKSSWAFLDSVGDWIRKHVIPIISPFSIWGRL